MIDSTLQLLLPHLTQIQTPTLWLADENAQPLIAHVEANENLTLVTNRYDIYQQAKKKNIQSIFSDFNISDYPQQSFEKIVYRISKEKALVNHIINQSAKSLQKDAKFIISGYKQEGIKSFSDNIKKVLHAQGKLKKTGSGYIGEYSHLSLATTLDDKSYHNLRKIDDKFYSKPGVFGWNKVDKGTKLLLNCVKDLISSQKITPKSVLDLGCGYGWIFFKIDKYGFEKITATDNNAAALIAAQKNTQTIKTATEVIASDCADTIDNAFDLVLCNPPFHQGFQHNQALTEKFIRGCAKKTKKNGHTLLVTNEFISFDHLAEGLFSHKKTLHKEQGFKVVLLSKSND